MERRTPDQRHCIYRSSSEDSGFYSGPNAQGQCSSVLFIPTGGDPPPPPRLEPSPAPASRPSSHDLYLVAPTSSGESHRTGLQIPVNTGCDNVPFVASSSASSVSSPTPARLFSSPRVQPRVQPQRQVKAPLVFGGQEPGSRMPSITCRDNVLEIRPASGDCYVRVNAVPGGKVRIKIPSTQQSSRTTNFRIADSLKLYSDLELLNEEPSEQPPDVLGGSRRHSEEGRAGYGFAHGPGPARPTSIGLRESPMRSPRVAAAAAAVEYRGSGGRGRGDGMSRSQKSKPCLSTRALRAFRVMFG